MVTGPGETRVIDVPTPAVGPNDALINMRACGNGGPTGALAEYPLIQNAVRGSSLEVVVFGAGPIGPGTTVAFKSVGVSHVVVADLIPARLGKAVEVGADAVINSADEDVVRAADRVVATFN
jgi:threonine dehydrogenase-like Zn-dependent dehydrogenase